MEESVFAKIGIDWRLLLTQAINFGILVFILTKFVYRPLLKTIKERQKLAKETVENAEASRKALENVEQETKRIEQAARKKADGVIKTAEAQANERRKALVAKAEEEGGKIVAQARRQAEAERAALFSETRRDMATLVIKAAEKVLEREVTKEDSKKLAERAVGELSK